MTLVADAGAHMRDEREIHLNLQFVDDADAEERDETMRQLRTDLAEAALAATLVVGGAAPPGAKGDGSLISTVGITLASSGVSSLVSVLATFVQQQRRRCKVTVQGHGGEQYEFESGSPDEIQEFRRRFSLSGE